MGVGFDLAGKLAGIRYGGEEFAAGALNEAGSSKTGKVRIVHGSSHFLARVDQF